IVPVNYSLEFPGALDEPGNRDINVPGENAVPSVGDTTPGISVIQYNFRADYGFDPTSGNTFLNVITENEKQRAREALEEISHVAGVQFVETANAGFTIATGDLRAILGCPPTGVGAPISASGLIHVQGASPISCIFPDTRTSIVLDASEGWDDSY